MHIALYHLERLQNIFLPHIIAYAKHSILPHKFCFILCQFNRRTNLNMSNAVGFIGIGIMGEGMAGRLLSEGIAGTPDKPLIIWNRTGQKCIDFKEKYPEKNVEIKQTAKEVVESSDVCYCMLSTPEASRAVFEAKDGVLAGIKEGKYIVDCATLAEADMTSMDEAVKAKGG